MMNTFNAFAEIAEIFETNMHAITMSKEGESDKARWDWAVAHWTATRGYEMPQEIADVGWRTFVKLSLITH